MVASSRSDCIAFTSGVILALLTLACPPASAHPAPSTTVMLDVGSASLGLDIEAPLSELGSALCPLRERKSCPEWSPSDLPRLNRYLLSHVGVSSAEGVEWSVQSSQSSITTLDGHQTLHAKLSLKPPAGISSRQFDLRYDAVTHEVMSHIVFVLLRSDFYKGELNSEPRLIATLQNPSQRLRVNQGEATSHWAGLSAAFALGLRHIAEGADHLLFVLVLALTAPVAAVCGRWRTQFGWRASARRMLYPIAAFSLGHSVCLAFGVAWGWRPNGAMVELCVAASIVISAWHAWRPLFPRWETWVAGAFGLVHGTAIAAAIGTFAFEPAARAIALMGFTAGIGLTQVLVATGAGTVLLALGRTAAFESTRVGAALISGAIAVLWIIQRAPAALNGPLSLFP